MPAGGGLQHALQPAELLRRRTAIPPLPCCACCRECSCIEGTAYEGHSRGARFAVAAGLDVPPRTRHRTEQFPVDEDHAEAVRVHHLYLPLLPPSSPWRPSLPPLRRPSLLLRTHHPRVHIGLLHQSPSYPLYRCYTASLLRPDAVGLSDLAAIQR